MGTVRVEAAGPLATIVIDNPGKRNALTADMWARFTPVLRELAEDRSVAVVVLRGAGDDFSAGADIGELDRILPEARADTPPGGAPEEAPDGAPDGGIMTEAENALAAFPKPTVAAIDGFCVGGGWELAGACDIRIASQRSTFGITPSRLGIVYPLSGIERLVRLAGPAVAKHLLYTGELVPATAALDYGLVTKLLPNYGFWDEAREFAHTLARRSQYSIRATKEIIAAMVGEHPADVADARAIARQWHERSSEDRHQGVAAFRDRREPEFTWHTRPTTS